MSSAEWSFKKIPINKVSENIFMQTLFAPSMKTPKKNEESELTLS